MNTVFKKKEIKDKLLPKTDAVNFRQPLVCFIAFCFSQLGIFDGFSPFSSAFLLCVKPELTLWAFFGSVSGYFLSFPFSAAFRYTIGLALAVLFRLVILRKLFSEDKVFHLGVVCTCCLLITSVIKISLDSADLPSLTAAFFQAAFGYISVALFKRAFETPYLSIGLKKLSGADVFRAVFFLCTFLMSFSFFTLGGISPARIIGAFCVIFLSQYKGISLGSISGICTGLSFGLPFSETGLFPVFSLSGLISGVFSSFGQYAGSLSFVLSSVLIILLHGFDSTNIFYIIEISLASVIYCAIPPSKISAFHNRIEKSSFSSDSIVEREISKKLFTASEKLSEVSDIVNRVSGKLDKIINPEINKVFSSLQQTVCYGCDKKKECWSTRFNETASDIMCMAGLRENAGIKTQLQRRCIKPNTLKRQLENHYGDFVNSMTAKMKMQEMRNIVKEQFDSLSLFLKELAFTSQKERVKDKTRGRNIYSALKDADINVSDVAFMTDSNHNISVDIELFDDITEKDLKKISLILELSTTVSFDKPKIDMTSDMLKISYFEKPSFKLNYGFSQIALAKNNVSGDALGHSFDENGTEYLILSDGMGTGARASIDATMTCALLEKLLGCGFSFESSIRTVNSALIIKSTDESLATVDTLSVNLYNGNAVFYKAGATLSFIRRGNSIKTINAPSMPLGIIRSISPFISEEKLLPGDIILLVSDGVTANDCGWINDEILAWSTGNMEDLASHIASLSKLRSEQSTADDISVLAVKVLQNP